MIVFSLIAWALCSKALPSLAFAPSGMTSVMHKISPFPNGIHEIGHKMIADGNSKDVPTINLGFKPDGKVRHLLPFLGSVRFMVILNCI